MANILEITEHNNVLEINETTNELVINQTVQIAEIATNLSSALSDVGYSKEQIDGFISALTFVITGLNFNSLGGVPESYKGASGQLVQVNSSEDGLEFTSRFLDTVPFSTTDSVGNSGDLSLDSDYLYIKTIIGWKRISLENF